MNDENKVRYFFFTTISKAPNGTLVINNLTHKTINVYPSLKSLIEISNIYFPNLRETVLIGLTEMKEDEFNQFVKND